MQMGIKNITFNKIYIHKVLKSGGRVNSFQEQVFI